MKNVCSGSLMHKEFFPTHLIYLLLCGEVIKSEPCGALWHGSALWQHCVWPYGHAGAWTFLHTPIAEHPRCTYTVLCIAVQADTACHSLRYALSGSSPSNSVQYVAINVFCCGTEETRELVPSWIPQILHLWFIERPKSQAARDERHAGKQHCIFAGFSSSSTTVRCGILTGTLIWPSLALFTQICWTATLQQAVFTLLCSASCSAQVRLPCHAFCSSPNPTAPSSSLALDLPSMLMLRGASSPFLLLTRDLVFVTDMPGHSKSNFSPFSHYLSAVYKVTTLENSRVAWHFNMVLIHC